MKPGIIAGFATIMMVAVPAHADAVPEPTTRERHISIETGRCVVREDREITSRMLLPGEDSAVQRRFMVVIRKCATSGTQLFPNIVMGAAAEKILADRDFAIGSLRSPEQMPEKFLDSGANRVFVCAIAANPTSLTRMLRTVIGGANELAAIEEFRLALVQCDATKGKRLTPANIRALAAKIGFVMATGVNNQMPVH